NVHISSLRISVEYRFGELMILLGYNEFKIDLKIGLSPAVAYSIVFILFRNIHSYFHKNRMSKKFYCSPPSVHTYLAGT
ncbi:hypothetical protein C7212DRAFT_191527, partial [Tuber magnatum]